MGVRAWQVEALRNREWGSGPKLTYLSSSIRSTCSRLDARPAALLAVVHSSARRVGGADDEYVIPHTRVVGAPPSPRPQLKEMNSPRSKAWSHENVESCC